MAHVFTEQGIMSRVYETALVLALLAILVCGLAYVASAIFDDNSHSRQALFGERDWCSLFSSEYLDWSLIVHLFPPCFQMCGTSTCHFYTHASLSLGWSCCSVSGFYSPLRMLSISLICPFPFQFAHLWVLLVCSLLWGNLWSSLGWESLAGCILSVRLIIVSSVCSFFTIWRKNFTQRNLRRKLWDGVWSISLTPSPTVTRTATGWLPSKNAWPKWCRTDWRSVIIMHLFSMK